MGKVKIERKEVTGIRASVCFSQTTQTMGSNANGTETPIQCARIGKLHQMKLRQMGQAQLSSEPSFTVVLAVVSFSRCEREPGSGEGGALSSWLCSH
jgi:hypothetical protein